MAMTPQMAGAIAKGAAKTVGGVITMVGSAFGKRKRIAEQKAADREFAMEKAAFQRMDTSNLAAGMQNTFEDLTVNQQQAQFLAQQQQQGLANTMGAMQGAAGGSGIAALAQAMAGQQSANLQQASASIGQQEAANQMAAAKGAQNVQQMQFRGAQMARQAETDKRTDLLGMAMERKGAADQAREDAKQAFVGGLSDYMVGGLEAAGDAMEAGG